MKVKDYVENCHEWFDGLLIDPYGQIVELGEIRKLDVFTMRYYTTHYLIDGIRYNPDDEI